MNEPSKRPAPQSRPDPLTRALNAEKRRQGAYGGGPLDRVEQVPQCRPPPRQSVPTPPAEVPIATPGPVAPAAPFPVTKPKIVPWSTPMPVDPPPPTFLELVSADLRELQMWLAAREPLWQPLVVWTVKIAIFSFALRLAGQLAGSFLDMLLPG